VWLKCNQATISLILYILFWSTETVNKVIYLSSHICLFSYLIYYTLYVSAMGHAAGGAVGWGNALQAGRSRVRFTIVSLEFFIYIILPAALWPWGRLSLYQKWVPGIFPGSKGGRYVGLTTLPPSCAHCLEIWEPQTSGTLRACPVLLQGLLFLPSTCFGLM